MLGTMRFLHAPLSIGPTYTGVAVTGMINENVSKLAQSPATALAPRRPLLAPYSPVAPRRPPGNHEDVRCPVLSGA